MTKSPTTRFSDRVDNYAKYRPSYPREMMDWFKSDDVGLEPEDVIADIGSGTGISTKLFLEAGCTVYGVEPNAPMRERAEQELAMYPKFNSVDGTAEDTTLPFDSVDMIICCQAFHWFDAEK
ncbi:MAG TPA: class I SAM-dependent methyltransferase, partial [Ignavibacteria bacterium]|nr:class I SAM-dependent methyltransferase [Ignavibacteria bacterium]